jgi:hypothetical protein
MFHDTQPAIENPQDYYKFFIQFARSHLEQIERNELAKCQIMVAGFINGSPSISMHENGSTRKITTVGFISNNISMDSGKDYDGAVELIRNYTLDQACIFAESMIEYAINNKNGEVLTSIGGPKRSVSLSCHGEINAENNIVLNDDHHVSTTHEKIISNIIKVNYLSASHQYGLWIEFQKQINRV